MKILRPTWAEIDIKAFRHNYAEVKKRLNRTTGILSVVKADAYGHGVVELAGASIDMGADVLGVALIEEGILLREKGIRAPILVMGSVFPLENYSSIIKYNLHPAICSLGAAGELSRLAVKMKRRAPVFIKIDTGMGRIGISHGHALDTIKRIKALPGLKLEGIYTHLAAASGDPAFTRGQIKKFAAILKGIEDAGIKIKYKSMANSTAVLKYPEAHFNIVRPGISLYGLLPYKGAGRDIGLKPVMSLKTRIVYLKEIKKGATVSYMRSWKAGRPSLIATLPIGYADGYSRMLSSGGQVLVKGQRVPIVGNICMDMCMVDVTGVDGVRTGDEVVLIGSQGRENISAEELAELAGSINYEVTCCIGKRVPRVFK